MKPKEVKIRQNASEQEWLSWFGLGKARKGRITMSPEDVLVVFKSKTRKTTRLEIHPRPQDDKLRFPGKGIVLLDPRFSENGGGVVTVDEDRMVHVGYELGQITRTVETDQYEDAEEQVADPKTGQVTIQSVRRPILRVEVVDVAVWEGVDGVQSMVNEEDTSFKQIAAGHLQTWLKMLKQMMTWTGIGLIMCSIALIFMTWVYADANNLELPKFGK